MNSRSASFRSALVRSIAVGGVLVLLGAAAGGLYGWSRERVAQAGAVILLNPLDGNPFSTSGRGDSLTNLETEAQLVRSFEVAEKVRTETGTDTSAADLVANLDVVPPTNTQLLEISYRDVDPARAVAVTQSFAEQFLAFREGRSRSVVEGQLKLVNAQIKERQTEQSKLSRALAKQQSAAQTALLQTQLDAVTTQINQLRARSAELEIGPFTPGQVVTPARLHREGVLDSWIAYAAFGALAGLVLTVLIAFIRSRMDTRIHHVDDILLTGRSLLGEVALADAASVHGGLSGLDQVPVPEAFRDLGVAVLTSEHRRPSVILVTQGSAESHDGPLSTGGLAVALAAGGLRTIVIDTLAAWPVAETTGPSRPGLGDVLAGGGDPAGALVEVADNLRLLPAAAPDQGIDLFLSPSMARLLEHLRQACDIVLVTSAGSRSSATRALSSQADALITEVVQGHSHATDAVLPELVNARDLGVVLITGIREGSRPARVATTTPRPADAPDASDAHPLDEGAGRHLAEAGSEGDEHHTGQRVLIGEAGEGDEAAAAAVSEDAASGTPRPARPIRRRRVRHGVIPASVERDEEAPDPDAIGTDDDAVPVSALA